MGNTQVGKLHKNRKVKDLNGNIIDWFDEANGGWIVKSRQVVNIERWNQEMAKQKDRELAAQAAASPKIRADYPETKESNPQVASKLEERVDKMEQTLEAILKAVSK